MLATPLVEYLRAHADTLDAEPSAAAFADLDPMTRVRTLRSGAPAAIVPALAQTLGLSRMTLIDGLGLSRATRVRRRASGALPADVSERVLDVLRLFGLATRMLEESGDPANSVDVGRWLGQWLDTSNPALGDQRPSRSSIRPMGGP